MLVKLINDHNPRSKPEAGTTFKLWFLDDSIIAQIVQWRGARYTGAQSLNYVEAPDCSGAWGRVTTVGSPLTLRRGESLREGALPCGRRIRPLSPEEIKSLGF